MDVVVVENPTQPEIGSSQGDRPISVRSVFLKVKIKGVSFMYHQIRRMVGLVIQYYLENRSKSEITQFLMLGNKKMVWTAPAQTLLLDRVLEY